MTIAPLPGPKKLAETLAEHLQALPDVWVHNELFEQTTDYLIRGRRFEKLRIDRLNHEWAKAFRLFVWRRSGPHVRDMDDAGAELRLRGAGFPTHLVAPEVNQLRNGIRHAGPVTPSAEFVRKFEDFVADLSKPTN
jgi:hypothetical protein